MRRLILFAIWCVVALSGVIMATVPPQSWSCRKYLNDPNQSSGMTMYSVTSNTLVRWYPSGDVEVWREGDVPVATYQIGSETRLGHLSPDGNLVTSLNNSDAVVWNALTGKLHHTVNLSDANHSNASYYFTPDNTKVLVQSFEDGETVQVWDMQSGQMAYTFKSLRFINTIAFSPDVTRIITGDDLGAISIWETSSGRLIQQVMKPSNYQYTIAISPDNQLALKGDAVHDISVWNISTGEEIASVPLLSGKVENNVSAWFSSDSKSLFVYHPDGIFRLWDIQTGQLVYTIDQPALSRSFIFSPDGKKLLIDIPPDGIQVVDTQTGKVLWLRSDIYRTHGTFQYSARAGLGNDLSAIQFSADGKQIMSVDPNNTVIWWDAQTGDLIRPLCPRMLGQRWIVAGIGLCVVAIFAAGWTIVRAAKG